MTGKSSGERRTRTGLRYELGVICAYVFFGFCGVLTILAPSVSLATQGGRILLYSWAAFCAIGSFLGLLGIVRQRIFTELWGASLTAAASLTWAVALVLQAVATGNAGAGTAAGMAGALTVLMLQRWLDANRPPRR